MPKLTREALEKYTAKKDKAAQCSYIKVGMSSCGIAAGARKVFDLLCEEVPRRYPSIAVRKCGCNGLCHAEPLVEVCVDGAPAVVYGRVTPEVAARIVEEHIGERRLINDHIYVMATKGVCGNE
jgi:NADP-reducing hydrogenase subunit HndB